MTDHRNIRPGFRQDGWGFPRSRTAHYARNIAGGIGVAAGLAWVLAYIGLGYIVSDERGDR